MKVAYADPPYLGCGKKRYAEHHAEAAAWDDPETHRDLIARLSSEFDAWALSLHTPSLRAILAMCPEDVRIGAWVKPFASFKPNVNPGYCWEPVIFRGGRSLGREVRTVRDYVSAPIALRKGLPGAKPAAFCWWVFDFLMLNPSKAGADRDDNTVSRCIEFARSWGFDGLRVTNLYALVSTDPKALYKHPSPVGPDNDQAIADAVRECELVVCAWGNHGGPGLSRKNLRSHRAYDVLSIVHAAGKLPYALKLTGDSQPNHPLYLPANLRPQPLAELIGCIWCHASTPPLAVHPRGTPMHLDCFGPAKASGIFVDDFSPEGFVPIDGFERWQEGGQA